MNDPAKKSSQGINSSIDVGLGVRNLDDAILEFAHLVLHLGIFLPRFNNKTHSTRIISLCLVILLKGSCTCRAHQRTERFVRHPTVDYLADSDSKKRINLMKRYSFNKLSSQCVC